MSRLLRAILRSMTTSSPPAWEIKRPRRIGTTTDSIALIANSRGHGCILKVDGEGVELNIHEFELRGLYHSAYSLEDNGLGDAPEGLSVWEGARRNNPHHDDPDHEGQSIELVGTFRDLTDREWSLLKDTGVPWEFESAPPSLPTFTCRCGAVVPRIVIWHVINGSFERDFCSPECAARGGVSAAQDGSHGSLKPVDGSE